MALDLVTPFTKVQLEEEIGCDTVLKIGRILILYKESAKKENRKLSPKVKAIPK